MRKGRWCDSAVSGPWRPVTFQLFYLCLEAPSLSNVRTVKLHCKVCSTFHLTINANSHVTTIIAFFHACNLLRPAFMIGHQVVQLIKVVMYKDKQKIVNPEAVYCNFNKYSLSFLTSTITTMQTHRICLGGLGRFSIRKIQWFPEESIFLFSWCFLKQCQNNKGMTV